MKTAITRAVAAVGPILIFTMLGWMFHLHGTIGLLRVEMLSQLAFVVAALIGVAPPTLMLMGWSKRGNPQIQARLHATTLVLSSAAMVMALFGFMYLAGFPLPPAGDTRPRLIVAAGSGSKGIPDIAIAIESRLPSRHTLTWGSVNAQSAIKEENPSKQHVFMLPDLEPATEYWYRIDDGREHRFTTPDATSRPLHFAVGSDAHFGAGNSRNDLTEKMLVQIADPANHFDYFFTLGDNVEFGFRPEQWEQARASFSSTMSKIPTVFAAGNHDALFTGLGRYLDYSYPEGMELDNGTRLWHRFDAGNVHFIVIDMEWSAEAFTGEQASWLERELQSIPTEDWTIVMGHGFYYGSGSVVRGWQWYDNPDTIQGITPLFEQYGVDIVFSGHDHQMELLEKSGVTYVIAGAFGGIPDPPRTYASPASIWYAAGNYGYMDISVDDAKAVVTFRDPDGADLKTVVLHK